MFLADEYPNWDKIAKRMSLSSNNQQHPSIPRNNLQISPKSVFLMKVMCENIRVLLEKCTTKKFLTNSPFSDIVSTEHQLSNILQNVENYCKGPIYDSPCEEYSMSDILENLAEMDQEDMLSLISHSLEKSLIEKLSCGIQPPPSSPPFTNNQLAFRKRKKLSSFPKTERTEFKESRQVKGSGRFLSLDKPLTEPLNNLTVIHSKM